MSPAGQRSGKGGRVRWRRPLLLLLVAVGIGAGALAQAGKGKLDLRKAELYLKRLDGRATKLGPFVGKRLTLVNLWATWCKPCRNEMPLLDALRKRYRARGFEVVGISVDEDPVQVPRYLAGHKVSYPILIGTDKTVPALGKLEAVPTSLLLDGSGDVLSVMVGEASEKELAADIERALGAARKN